MNPRTLFVFLFLVCGKILLPQETGKQLKVLLNSAKHDTAKCRILNALVEDEFDPKIWGIYNEQLKNISEKGRKLYPAPDPLHKIFTSYLSAVYNNTGFIYNGEGNFTKALENFNTGLKLSEEVKDTSGISHSLNNIASVYESQGNISKALEYYKESIQLKEMLGDNAGISQSLNNIGYIYKNLGDIQKALEYFHKSLKIDEVLNDKSGVAYSLNNIGAIYAAQGDLQKALQYYEKSLKIRRELNDLKEFGNTLSNIGTLYEAKGDIEKAMKNYFESLEIHEKTGNLPGVANTLYNIGSIYKTKKDLPGARAYFQKSLKIREDIKDKPGMAFCLNSLANISFKQKNIPEAILLANKSLFISKELGYPENIRNSAHLLFNIYQSQNNSVPALEMLELYLQMRDSILNQETRKASAKQQIAYEYGKREIALKAEQEKKDIIYAEQSRNQQIIITSVFIGLLLVVLFSVFLFTRFRITSRQTKTIEEQKLIVDGAYKQLHEKNKEITDSIIYARRIQRALLTTEKYIEKQLTKLSVK